ncbi:1893_t:CDS:2, partial [Dentiscutata erythropus]
IEEEDCFVDGYSQLTFILDSTRSHEAYTNQRIERKVAALSASGSNYRF